MRGAKAKVAAEEFPLPGDPNTGGISPMSSGNATRLAASPSNPPAGAARRRSLLICAVLTTVLLLVLGVSTVAQAATHPKPSIVSVTLSPKTLGLPGGTVTVTARTKDASTCSLKVVSDQGLKVTVPKASSCSNGKYTGKVVIGRATTKKTVTLDLVASVKDPMSATKVVYIGLTPPAPAPKPVPASGTTTTTVPTPGGLVPALGGGGTPTPGIAVLDPSCSELTSTAYEMSCSFSVSGVSAGVLTFSTTLIPNDANAPLEQLATNGCSFNVTGSLLAGTCNVQYPAAGTYYAQVVYEGGTGANSVSSVVTITVPEPTPASTTTTTTAPEFLLTTTSLSVGSGSAQTGYQFDATVTDTNGTVSPPAGTVVFSAISSSTFESTTSGPEHPSWDVITSSAGQSSCQILFSYNGTNWVITSSNCTVDGNEVDPNAEASTEPTLTLNASFSGSGMDAGSASTSPVQYPES